MTPFWNGTRMVTPATQVTPVPTTPPGTITPPKLPVVTMQSVHDALKTFNPAHSPQGWTGSDVEPATAHEDYNVGDFGTV